MADVALYHLSAKTVSRADGRSSTAAAAYRAAVRIVDLRTGEIHDYTRKAGVLHSEIILPEGGTVDRSEFWNAIEKHHKRGDAMLSREVEISLPTELKREERKALAVGFARELADRYGVAVDVALHAPRTVTDKDLEKDPDQYHETDETGRRHNGNWHAHILMSACYVSADGTMGKKCVELDPIHCQRARLENCVEVQRREWQDICNAALEKAGHSARIDHRTLVAQGVEDRPAGVHRGPAVNEILQGGRPSFVADRVADEVKEFLAEVQADAAIAAAKESAERELVEAEAEQAEAEQLVIELKNQEANNERIRAAAFADIARNFREADEAFSGTRRNLKAAGEAFDCTRSNLEAVISAGRHPDRNPERIQKTVKRWRFERDFRAAFISAGNVLGQLANKITAAVRGIVENHVKRAPAKSLEDLERELKQAQTEARDAEFRQMNAIPTAERKKAVDELTAVFKRQEKLEAEERELAIDAGAWDWKFPFKQHEAKKDLKQVRAELASMDAEIQRLGKITSRDTIEDTARQGAKARARVEQLKTEIAALQPHSSPSKEVIKALALEQEKTVRRLVERQCELEGYNNPQREADQRMRQLKAENRIHELAKGAEAWGAQLTAQEQKQANEPKKASEDDDYDYAPR